MRWWRASTARGPRWTSAPSRRRWRAPPGTRACTRSRATTPRSAATRTRPSSTSSPRPPTRARSRPSCTSTRCAGTPAPPPSTSRPRRCSGSSRSSTRGRRCASSRPSISRASCGSWAEYDEAEQLVQGLGFFEAWQVLGSFDNDQGKGFQTAYAAGAGRRSGAHVHRRAPAHPFPPAGREPARRRPPARRRAVSRRRRGGLRPDVDRGHARPAGRPPPHHHQRGARLAERRAGGLGRQDLPRGARQRGRAGDAGRGPEPPPGEVGARDRPVPPGGAHHRAGRDRPRRPARIAASKPATGAAAAGVAGAIVSPMGAIDKLADKNRKSFLQARLWAREGHARRASWFLEPLLRAAPDNRVVMLLRGPGAGGQRRGRQGARSAEPRRRHQPQGRRVPPSIAPASRWRASAGTRRTQDLGGGNRGEPRPARRDDGPRAGPGASASGPSTAARSWTPS